MKCSYFLQSQCTSCSLLDESYPETLSFKEEKLRSLFPAHGHNLRPTIGLSIVEQSRGKAKFSVFMQNGEITFGLTNAYGVYQELEHCPLHAQGINELLPVLKEALVKYKIIPYDIKNKKGELKFVLITKNDKSSAGEFLIRFVLRSKESLDRLRKAVAELVELPNKIKVVTANIQPVHQAILEGDEEIVLSPEQAVIHQFDEFQLAMGARSFFQVTPEIAKKLYGAVADSIALDKPGSLLDLYCGVGAFTFYASRGCEDVTGVEVSKEAVDCARTSARLNKSHVEFHAMDVESFLLDSNKKFDAVIVNPPRRGLNAFIINKIKQIEPDFIYYSSCNPETLARDYLDFKEGYEIKSLQIFDMFPYTTHFETLMCLAKTKSPLESGTA